MDPTAAHFLDETRPTHARIVATIGPASEGESEIRRLIEAGVNVFRFNFSHGTSAEHDERLRRVRQVAAQLERPVACLGDLPGPKIRVGKVPEGGIDLRPGMDVAFRADLAEARVVQPDGNLQALLPTTYPELVREVEPGQRVLLADGAIRMLAVACEGGELCCRVTVGGRLTSGKGINLPETDIRAPSITDADWKWVEWAVERGIDFLAMSFVRSAEEVSRLRKTLWNMCSARQENSDAGAGSMIPVIAKIEKPQALARIEEIVEAADGIMVARGDLGVEMDIARVPVAQKRIIAACRERGKPVIVATQMLESMIESASPTRAEATDVANAIFEGAGAVMLSGETAIGRHPELVVETMRRIILAAEDSLREEGMVFKGPTLVQKGHALTAALTTAAFHAARDLNAAAIAVWSQHGGTARYLSQTGLMCPILACSSSERATRRMALLPGVIPIHAAVPGQGRLMDWSEWAQSRLRTLGLAHDGDWVVYVAGKPLGEAKRTNTMAIHRLGDPGGPFSA